MATASIILWTHYEKEGKYSVKIAVNNNDERRYYAVRPHSQRHSLYLTKEEFIEHTGKRKTNINKLLNEELQRAIKAISTPFNWNEFEYRFTNKTGNSFYQLFEADIAALKNSRPGTYLSYLAALKAWQRYKHKGFNVQDLGRYLPGFADTIKGDTTRGIYLRATRRVYNSIKKKKNFLFLPPWDFTIEGGSDTHKGRFITPEQLQKFAKAKVTPAQAEARRIFFISFYCNGMNMIDILNLKHSDIKTEGNLEHFTYIREKTKRSKKKKKKITVIVGPVLKDLLGKGLGYVISDFDRTGSVLKQRNRVKGYLKNINTRIKAICTQEGIEPFTSYSARHSFASSLKHADVSTERIQELLGHSNITITENYLSQFDLDDKKKTVDKLPSYKMA